MNSLFILIVNKKTSSTITSLISKIKNSHCISRFADISSPLFSSSGNVQCFLVYFLCIKKIIKLYYSSHHSNERNSTLKNKNYYFCCNNMCMMLVTLTLIQENVIHKTLATYVPTQHNKNSCHR